MRKEKKNGANKVYITDTSMFSRALIFLKIILDGRPAVVDFVR